MDGASRALERLSRAAERGADLLERAEDEIGLERVSAMLDRLGLVLDTMEAMHASLQNIEGMIADLHAEHFPPAPPPTKKSATRGRR